jgi:hypothetical protein
VLKNGVAGKMTPKKHEERLFKGTSKNVSKLKTH